MRLALMYMLMLATVSAAEAAQTLPFPVAAATEQAIAQEQLFDATVEAVNQSTVSAQVAGRIESIAVDVNDYVAKDAVILRFRSPEQRAGVEAMQATLNEAQARRQEAAAEYARMKSVYERHLVAKAALDKASADLKAAQARLEAAQASLAQSQEQLGHTEVRAPYSGIVVKRHVQVGESVNPGQPLITGLSLDSLRVVADVPQNLIDAVRSRNTAHVILSGPDGRTLAVSGLTIFPYADPQTHTFKVRVNLPAGVRDIYPGMLLKVAFVTGEQTTVLVPAQAIVHRSEVTAVYVVGKGDHVALRQVRIGRRHDPGGIEVLAGLQAGERVALDPIRAGMYLKENP
jgi:RND family efflux transporter MFP subunit